jgi:hypothetical protein
MPLTCQNGTDIPTLQSEPCNGEYTSTNCVTIPEALSYLNLPANATVTQVFNALVLALQFKDQQIQELQDQIGG